MDILIGSCFRRSKYKKGKKDLVALISEISFTLLLLGNSRKSANLPCSRMMTHYEISVKEINAVDKNLSLLNEINAVATKRFQNV